MRRLMPLVALVALLANCNFFFPFAPDQICETLIRAQCRFAFNCCNAAERVQFADGAAAFRSEGECINESLEERGVCANERVVIDANAQGRFTYDTALAEQCLKPLVDALNNCDVQIVFDEEVAEECEVDGFAFGTPNVAAGEACFASFECADDGAVCDPPDDDPDDDQILLTSVGSCLAPQKIGDACDPAGIENVCEAAAFCDPIDEECVALKDNNDECLIDEECASEFCNNLVAIPECDDKLDDGEQCFENDDCISDFCEFDADEDESFCAQPPAIVVQACNGLQQNDTQF